MADNKLLGASGLYYGGNEISKAYMGYNLVWEKSGEAGPDYSKEYFYIESINDNTTVSLAAGSYYFKYVVLRQGVFPDGLPSFLLYEYWDNIYEAYGGDFTSSSTGIEITTLNEGERLIILGNNERMGATSIPNIFTFSDSVNVGGNIMSLTHGLDSNNDKVDPSTLPNKQFNNSESAYLKQLYRLFKNQPVVDAENLVLSATTLGYSQSYREMFYGCTSLIKAPKELPATTLGDRSYYEMFRNCSSLTTAPVLPATTLNQLCYIGMFRNCSSLTTAPVLPATTLVTSCYNSMFYGCTSLVTAPVLPATTLGSSCYYSMFYGCTSLTTAPILPATTLVSQCYYFMFRNCTKLNYIKAMFTTTPSTSYTRDWVNGVSVTGTFVKNSVAEWTDTGTYAVPEGWTVQTASS